jgi:hypothetical protein
MVSRVSATGLTLRRAIDLNRLPAPPAASLGCHATRHAMAISDPRINHRLGACGQQRGSKAALEDPGELPMKLER